MLKLELDEQEQDALADVLISSLSELRTEIGHTDQMAFRQRLRTQEALLKKILERLQPPA
jgi:hypothetical protein